MPGLQDIIPSQLTELRKRLAKPALVRRFQDSTIQYTASVVSQLIKGQVNAEPSAFPTESDRQACLDAPLRAEDPQGETVSQAFANILALLDAQNLKALVCQALTPLAEEINASPSVKQALAEQGFVFASKVVETAETEEATTAPRVSAEPAAKTSSHADAFDFFSARVGPSKVEKVIKHNFVEVDLTQGPLLARERDHYIAQLLAHSRSQKGDIFKTFFARALDLLDGTLILESGAQARPTLEEIKQFAAQHYHPLDAVAVMIAEKYLALDEVVREILESPGRTPEEKARLEKTVNSIQAALKALAGEIVRNPMAEGAHDSVKIFKAELVLACKGMPDKAVAKQIATAAMDVVSTLPVKSQSRSNMNFRCRPLGVRRAAKAGSDSHDPALLSAPRVRH